MAMTTRLLHLRVPATQARASVVPRPATISRPPARVGGTLGAER